MKKKKQRVIDAAEKALIELNKVATQTIDLAELDPEKAKTAAAAKKQAIFDAFDIIERIEQEKALLEDKPEKEKETKSFFGVEGRVK